MAELWTRRGALTFEGREDWSPPCQNEVKLCSGRHEFMYLLVIVAGRHSPREQPITCRDSPEWGPRGVGGS